MKFEWNVGKSKANKMKHGFSFEIAPEFDFENALISIDDRLDYGEERLVAIGLVRTDVFVMVYTERDDVIRVISLRKATRGEIRVYLEG